MQYIPSPMHGLMNELSATSQNLENVNRRQNAENMQRLQNAYISGDPNEILEAKRKAAGQGNIGGIINRLLGDTALGNVLGVDKYIEAPDFLKAPVQTQAPVQNVSAPVPTKEQDLLNLWVENYKGQNPKAGEWINQSEANKKAALNEVMGKINKGQWKAPVRQDAPVVGSDGNSQSVPEVPLPERQKLMDRATTHDDLMTRTQRLIDAAPTMNEKLKYYTQYQSKAREIDRYFNNKGEILPPAYFGIGDEKKKGTGGGNERLYSYGVRDNQQTVLIPDYVLRQGNPAVAMWLKNGKHITSAQEFNPSLLTPQSNQAKEDAKDDLARIQVDDITKARNSETAEKIRSWFDNLSSEKQAQMYGETQKELKALGYNLDYNYNSILPNRVAISDMPVLDKPEFKSKKKSVADVKY